VRRRRPSTTGTVSRPPRRWRSPHACAQSHARTAVPRRFHVLEGLSSNKALPPPPRLPESAPCPQATLA
jgi:hypothetical protein